MPLFNYMDSIFNSGTYNVFITVVFLRLRNIYLYSSIAVDTFNYK